MAKPLVDMVARGNALEAGASELLGEVEKTASSAFEAGHPIGTAIGVLGFVQQRPADAGQTRADNVAGLCPRLDSLPNVSQAPGDQTDRCARSKRHALRAEVKVA